MVFLTGCSWFKKKPQPPRPAEKGDGSHLIPHAVLPTRFEYHQLCMGVDTKLVVYADTEPHAQSACQAAFERVDDLEQIMSDYRPTSELMQLCAKAGGPPVPISEPLYTLLSFGQRVAAESDGGFDMTVGPMVRLWRDSRKSGKLPSTDNLSRAKKLVGYDMLELNPTGRTARLTTPGMLLDLGGIAKGYAGDEAVRVLKNHGISSALFQAGGDIVLSDPPPDQTGWRINLPHPPSAQPLGESPRTLAPTTQPTESKIYLHNCALSTSGDSNQFVDIDGVRYSHLVDPRTGLGLTDRTLVTIISPTGLTSDPLSKAVSLLPRSRLPAFLKHFPRTTVYTRHVALGQ